MTWVQESYSEYLIAQTYAEALRDWADPESLEDTLDPAEFADFATTQGFLYSSLKACYAICQQVKRNTGK